MEIDLACSRSTGAIPGAGAGKLQLRGGRATWHGVNAGLVIPCHYEMFEFNTVSPHQFVEAAEQIRQKHHLLKCGERLDL
jgi:L-ascorbate metabolism protein UlaG (beta-lactamase superfamily)